MFVFTCSNFPFDFVLCRRNDGGGPYDLADLDQALFLYGDQGQPATGGDPSAALSSIQDHQRREIDHIL